MIKFLDLQKQYLSIKAEIDTAISNVLSSSAFIGGENVRRFEDRFAAYLGVKHCIGVGNGTDALEIAIEALQLPQGSEIIVPAQSFIASSEAVTRSGHKVVFCDINPKDYTLDIQQLEAKITPQTSAVIAVHLYGHPCYMDEIKLLSQQFDFKIIEDCAQAHGAEWKGAKVGGVGDIGTFSFYPGKNLGAYGDGGAIVTPDSALAERCRMIANHGRLSKYNHEFEGRNSRLDGLQAAILNVKLSYLPQWTERRIEVAEAYLDGLKEFEDVVLPTRHKDAKQVYHLFVIKTSQRKALQSYLKEAGIQTGIHYPVTLPDLPAYQAHGFLPGSYPMAKSLAEECLSLPIGDHLENADVECVIETVKRFVDAGQA